MATPNVSVLSPQTAPFLAGATFLLIAGAMIWFIAVPQIYRFMDGGDLNASAQQSTLEQKTKYLQNLQKLKAISEQIEAQGATGVNNILPSDKDIPTLFATYEAIAHTQGVELGSVDIVTPADASKQSGLNQLQVSLRMSGVRYATFKTFLKSLESLQRVADVKSFGYDAKSGFLNIGLTTYYENK